jgi:hypothetical protein
MPAASPEQLRLGIVVVGVLLVVLVAHLVRRWLARWRLASRFAAARRGETRGRALLEAQGYAVLASQCAASYELSVDGAAVEIALRADYIVARAGRRYVAEVKTGTHAPLLRTPATRRQLLEYRVAFDVDGVLLVDAESRRIHVVQFPLTETRQRERLSPMGWVVVALGIIAIVAARWQ